VTGITKCFVQEDTLIKRIFFCYSDDDEILREIKGEYELIFWFLHFERYFFGLR